MAEKEYLELYKKYRPTRWAALIGQERVAASLKSAVLSDKVPTAYLFSGPRGCGKTSAAFVLAKSLNCEARKDNGDPCNKCEVCVNIDRGRQLGVTYVSMANKGSADDVRELMRQARLSQPVKKQIFILDEIHNLSRAASDALLIPLEEKNMNSLFIFCTTEIEKVPQTILSRLQQRRFTLVDPETMEKHLRNVVKHAELEATDEDIAGAIRMGRGSVRDTLSALDTILATGETSVSYGGRLLTAMGERDMTAIFAAIAEANHESVDFRELTEQLFEDLRDLLLIDAGVDSNLVGVPPVSDPSGLVKRLGGPRGIQIFMKEIGEGITQMSMGQDSRILLEVSILKGFATLKKLIQAAQSNR